MKKSTRISSITFALALAVGVAGCGGDEDTEPLGDVPTIGSGAEPTDQSTGDTDDTDAADDTGAPTDDTGSATGDDDDTATDDVDDSTATGGAGKPDSPATETDGQTAQAIAAINLAEQEVGGVAYELDDEDDQSGWKVDVNVDGRDYEVLVNWEGTEVIRSSADGTVDSDDIGKLQVVTLTIQEGIEAAFGEVPGHVVAVDLETENGVVVWEVEFDDNDRDVYVNAQDGSIVKIDD